MISNEEFAKLKQSLNDDTIVIAVSKTRTIDEIKLAAGLGITDFGENKLQELKAKFVSDYTWHFIGTIQTNKIKDIVKYASLIHSVDRIEVINVIDKEAGKINKVQSILIQVNVLNEEGKSGVRLDKLDELVTLANSLPNILLKGFMVVGPTDMDVVKTEYVFIKMNEIFNYYKSKNPDINYLSMGMSDDYELALKHGSNMIRIGTKIFGERNYGGNKNEK